MTDSAQARIAEMVAASPVLLFMKGTPLFPQCGFSSTAIAILDHLGLWQRRCAPGHGSAPGHQGLFRLADHSATVCERRICRRVRHYDGNV
jgi:hypothetical protein